MSALVAGVVEALAVVITILTLRKHSPALSLLFNPHNNPKRSAVFIYPHFTVDGTVPGRLHNLSQVTAAGQQ